MTREELYARAQELAGRPVEVEQTAGGQWVVLWMSFDKPPPPTGETEDEALEKFIAGMAPAPDLPPVPVELQPSES